MIYRLGDIAAAAGVSTATVSRVLNERPGVAAATRARVLEATAKLTSIPQPLTNRRHIAVLLPDHANPTFAAFASELSLLLTAAGCVMVTLTSGQGLHEGLAPLLRSLGAVGLITVSGSMSDALASPDEYLGVNDEGIALVSINAHDSRVTGTYLSTSDGSGVTQAVEHLRSLGHSRIGLAVGQRRYQPTARKVATFLRLGLPEESLVSTYFTAEGGRNAAAQLLDSGHTAIVFGSDVMALGGILAAKARGLDVPGEVSIVGYDDSPLMAFTAPALTTVRQPIAGLCRAAVDALLSALVRPPASSAELFFQPDLIIRQSTGPAHV